VTRQFTITVPGKPSGKGRPRFTKIGRTYTPAKTVATETLVGECAFSQVGQPMLVGPLEVEITAIFEVPPSWARRKQAEALSGGVLPTGKPDLDNIAKLYTDALNGIMWADDATITRMTLSKHYGLIPATIIHVRQIEDAS
jgi:Holliday junction resolvase RusA-like endonuclease